MSEVSTYCFDCGVVAVPERGMIRHADGCSKQASKAPSSPMGETDGSARPIPPEALNGLTGAAYTAVIRREADTTPPVDVEAWWAATAKVTRERDEALALVVDLQTGLVSALTTSGRLRVERDEARATIERLRQQLSEATNVPDAPTEPAPELEREGDAPSPVTLTAAIDMMNKITLAERRARALRYL